MASKCNECKHKSEVDIYDYQTCIRCTNNPYVMSDMFDVREVEIRPEQGGEVWQYGENKVIHFVIYKDLQGDSGIQGIIRNGLKQDISPAMIHGKNGWTLLYSPDKEVMDKVKVDKEQSLMNERKELVESKCTEENPCCERRDEYNGFGSDGPIIFKCSKSCMCHD